MASGRSKGGRWARGVALVLALATAISAGVWYAGALDTLGFRSYPLHRSTMFVAPGIGALAGLSPSSAYVIETSEGLILIDSGLEADASPVKAELAKLGLDWRRIRAILLTHAHGDHTGGAATLRRQTGARLYVGAGDAAVLREGGPREAFFSTFAMPGHTPHPTPVDVELRGGELIVVGDVRVEAISAPGHTPGSTCYLSERQGLRAFFAGDVIMMLRGDEPPRDEMGKPLGTYSAYLAPSYRGDARATLQSLKALRRIPVPDLVLPGHPRAQPNPEDPRISQSRWEEILDSGIRDMENLIARFKADGADFLDGHPRLLLPNLYYLGERGGAAVYGFYVGERFFLVDAPGGPGLLAFVADQLRQLGREPARPSAVLLTDVGPLSTQGLADMVEKANPVVIAGYAGIDRAREVCPPGTSIGPAEELSDRGWFPVETVTLDGRGWSPIAYRVILGGKSVLFSGQIPVKMSQEAGESLIADLTHPPGDPQGYLRAMTRLHRAGRSDLWLPLIPTHGQNANLYGQDWDRTIEENLAVLRAVVSPSSVRRFERGNSRPD